MTELPPYRGEVIIPGPTHAGGVVVRRDRGEPRFLLVTARRQAGYPGRGNDSSGTNEAECRSFMVHIAEPGAAFRTNGLPASASLPMRRLAAAGCSYDHCLVYYERAGIAHTWQVALFHWTPDATRFEWGGTAPGGLVTIDEVRSAVLSGAIKGPVASW